MFLVLHRFYDVVTRSVNGGVDRRDFGGGTRSKGNVGLSSGAR